MIKHNLSVLQPSLVNDQLGQLYMDMQLEGTGDRLHLEGGSTASSSSDEESSSVNPKRKKVREIHFNGVFGTATSSSVMFYNIVVHMSTRKSWQTEKFKVYIKVEKMELMFLMVVSFTQL